MFLKIQSRLKSPVLWLSVGTVLTSLYTFLNVQNIDSWGEVQQLIVKIISDPQILIGTILALIGFFSGLINNPSNKITKEDLKESRFFNMCFWCPRKK